MHRPFASLAAVCAVWLTALAPASAGDWNNQFYHLRQGVTFYVANPQGKAFDIEIDLKDINTYCQGAQTALFKVYAPDGTVLHREDIPDDGVTSGAYQQAWAGWDHEMWALGGLREAGAEPLFRPGGFSDPARLERIKGTLREVSVPAGAPGTYQIQLVGCDDHYVKLGVSAGLTFGVVGHPDFLAGHDDQYETAYLYVPALPHYVKPADSLDVWVIEHGYPRTREIQVLKGGQPITFNHVQTGEQVTTLTPGQGLGQYKIADPSAIAAGDVLEFRIQGKGDYLLKVNGVPRILCPDEATARAIRGGVLGVGEGGPVVAFPYQRELWDAVKHLTREDVTIPATPGEWFKTTDEQVKRITHYNWNANHKPQVVDATVNRVEGILKKQKDFDVWGVIQALNLSFSDLDGLAMYYLYPFKGNTLYHNEQLRNVITLGLIRPWLEMRAGEVIYRPHELNVAYMQGFHWEYWQPVYYMKESFDPKVLAAFQKGVSRIAERMHYANGLELVITNGRTTVPLNIYHAYLITDQPHLKVLSKRYFMRMYTALDGPHSGRSKTGYFREHFAPDGGYTTYPMYQLGMLYQLSKDKDVLAALDQLARWTVATAMPAGGRMTGPSSWNGRIHAAAIEHIWGMGYRYFSSDSKWAATLAHHFDKATMGTPDPDMEPGKDVPDKPTLLLTHLSRDVTEPHPFPSLAEGDMIEDLGGGGEFFLVRRGGYFGIVYSGKRPPFWMDATMGGTQGYNGGGLAGLYKQGAKMPMVVARQLKEYGFPVDRPQDFKVPVVAGVSGDGEYFHTGAARTQVAFDRDNWSVVTTGEVIPVPVNFKRGYTFGSDGIQVSIELRNADLHNDVFQYRKYFREPWQSIREAWEIIPVWELEKTTVTAFDVDGKSLGDLDRGEPLHGLHHRDHGEAGTPGKELANVGSVVISREGMGKLTVRFAEPATVRLTSSLQILVGRAIESDKSATLNYTLVPAAD